MFVKYPCGCIGFPPGEDEKSVIVSQCDSEDGSLGFSKRYMDGKTYEPNNPSNSDEIIKEMSRLMHAGYRFRELKMLLS